MTAVTEQILDEMVRAIVREIDPEQVYLFGSRARGDARADSDVDLLIVDHKPFGSGQADFRKLTGCIRCLHLFTCRRTSCCIQVRNLLSGVTRSTMLLADVTGKESSCMRDLEHARLMLML